MRFWNVIVLTLAILLPASTATAETRAYTSDECVTIHWSGGLEDSYGYVLNNSALCNDLKLWDTHTDVEFSKGVIEFRGQKHYIRNFNSAFVTTLLGYDTQTDNAPLSDSLYLSKAYNLASTKNQRIYMKPDSNTAAGFYLVPYGENIISVRYINLLDGVEYYFQIQMFKPDGEGLSFEAWEVDEASGPDELTFTEEEALEGLTDEKTDGLEFTEQDLMKLAFDDDEMMLLACAANHPVCDLAVNPANARTFLNIDSEQSAKVALQKLLAELAKPK